LSGVVCVKPNSVSVADVGGFTAQPAQVEPVATPQFYPVYQPYSFDFSNILQLMMQMMQMVLMIVLIMLPIKMLPDLLSSVKQE